MSASAALALGEQVEVALDERRRAVELAGDGDDGGPHGADEQDADERRAGSGRGRVDACVRVGACGAVRPVPTPGAPVHRASQTRAQQPCPPPLGPRPQSRDGIPGDAPSVTLWMPRPAASVGRYHESVTVTALSAEQEALFRLIEDTRDHVFVTGTRGHRQVDAAAAPGVEHVEADRGLRADRCRGAQRRGSDDPLALPAADRAHREGRDRPVRRHPQDPQRDRHPRDRRDLDGQRRPDGCDRPRAAPSARPQGGAVRRRSDRDVRRPVPARAGAAPRRRGALHPRPLPVVLVLRRQGVGGRDGRRRHHRRRLVRRRAPHPRAGRHPSAGRSGVQGDAQRRAARARDRRHRADPQRHGRPHPPAAGRRRASDHHAGDAQRHRQQHQSPAPRGADRSRADRHRRDHRRLRPGGCRRTPPMSSSSSKSGRR